MIRYALLPCVLFAACGDAERVQRPAPVLEAFPASAIGEIDCTFFAEGSVMEGGDASREYVFATRLDDAENRAVASFGGETLQLFPSEPPRFDGTDEEVIYGIENYPGYDLRVKVKSDEAVGFTGTVEMRKYQGETPDVISAIPAYGSCGG